MRFRVNSDIIALLEAEVMPDALQVVLGELVVEREYAEIGDGAVLLAVLHQRLGLMEIDVRMAAEALDAAAIDGQEAEVLGTGLEPGDELLVVQTEVLQLADVVVASQLLAVAHNHAGDAAADARNLLELGGVCGVEVDDNDFRIFESSQGREGVWQVEGGRLCVGSVTVAVGGRAHGGRKGRGRAGRGKAGRGRPAGGIGAPVCRRAAVCGNRLVEGGGKLLVFLPFLLHLPVIRLPVGGCEGEKEMQDNHCQDAGEQEQDGAFLGRFVVMKLFEKTVHCSIRAGSFCLRACPAR